MKRGPYRKTKKPNRQFHVTLEHEVAGKWESITLPIKAPDFDEAVRRAKVGLVNPRAMGVEVECSADELEVLTP